MVESHVSVHLWSLQPRLPSFAAGYCHLFLGILQSSHWQTDRQTEVKAAQRSLSALTIRWNGSGVSAAFSSSSQYSSSSHILCRVLSGSLNCTGIFTLESSLPMLFLRMSHRLMLILGLGEGRQDLRRGTTLPSSTGPQENEMERCLMHTL